MSEPTSEKSGINISPILAMARRAADLLAQGRDVVDLTLGEPDFASPEHVTEAAIKAARRPLGYSPSNGIPELRSAIRGALLRDKELSYGDPEIAVGCGAKQIIFNAFLATIEAADEVIVPTPYWASYPDIVRLCGGKPVIVDCSFEDNFQLSAADLAAAITPKTRWLILNAPGNPSGVLYSRDALLELADVLRRHPHVFVMSDEIYAHVRYTSEDYVNLAAMAPDLRDRILIVDGVSKAYAMTGWRVGWGCGPASLISRISAIQGQNCTQTATLSQIAAVAALGGSQSVLKERAVIYRQRRDNAIAILRSCSLLEVPVPQGAFYLFPRLKVRKSDMVIAELLLDAGVATVPGSAFGSPGHLRLSFATDMSLLEEGCRRIVTALGGAK